jgi:hypothetical protein
MTGSGLAGPGLKVGAFGFIFAARTCDLHVVGKGKHEVRLTMLNRWCRGKEPEDEENKKSDRGQQLDAA